MPPGFLFCGRTVLVRYPVWAADTGMLDRLTLCISSLCGGLLFLYALYSRHRPEPRQRSVAKKLYVNHTTYYACYLWRASLCYAALQLAAFATLSVFLSSHNVLKLFYTTLQRHAIHRRHICCIAARLPQLPPARGEKPPCYISIPHSSVCAILHALIDRGLSSVLVVLVCGSGSVFFSPCCGRLCHIYHSVATLLQYYPRSYSMASAVSGNHNIDYLTLYLQLLEGRMKEKHGWRK